MEILTQTINTKNLTNAYIRDALKNISLQNRNPKTGKINLSLDLCDPQYIEVESRKTDRGEAFKCNFFRKTPDNEVRNTFSTDVYLDSAERDVEHLLDTIRKQIAEEDEKQIFEGKCYEAYQLDWMMSHGHSLADLYKILRDNIKEEAEALNESDISRLVDSSRDTFLYEQGFGSGSIFVCRDEFLTHEYQDIYYMKHLLNSMFDSEKMKKLYHRYTNVNVDNICDLEIETSAGTLKAYKSSFTGQPGICVMLQPDGVDDEIDCSYIFVAEDPDFRTDSDEDRKDVVIMGYGDPGDEDYTTKEIIRRKDVRDAFSISYYDDYFYQIIEKNGIKHIKIDGYFHDEGIDNGSGTARRVEFFGFTIALSDFLRIKDKYRFIKDNAGVVGQSDLTPEEAYSQMQHFYDAKPNSYEELKFRYLTMDIPCGCYVDF